MNKLEALKELEFRVIKCRNCPHLVRTRTQTVFGTGNPDAEFFFLGEAPGKDEDQLGEPFVGRAGQFLTTLIRLMGFKRKDVYIANVLKCRPDADKGNRKPEPDEMQACLPFLIDQIQIIQPKVIIALGATAVEGLFGEPCAITKERGRKRIFNGTPVILTLHPAYVLRNPTEETRKDVWSDICRAMELVGYDTRDRADWVPKVFDGV